MSVKEEGQETLCFRPNRLHFHIFLFPFQHDINYIFFYLNAQIVGKCNLNISKTNFSPELLLVDWIFFTKLQQKHPPKGNLKERNRKSSTRPFRKLQ